MDRNRIALLAAALILAGGAWWYWRREQDPGQGADAAPGASLWDQVREYIGPALEPLEQLAGSAQDAAEDLVAAVTPGPWSPPAKAQPYLPRIYAIEDTYGIPRNLLARVVHQETHYRPEIIDGRIASSAGAIGIAQLMPATAAAYGVDPRDWWASLDVAGQELRQTYRRFGTWEGALGSYNWGQGNWNSFLKTGKGASGQARPLENENYVAQILGDLRLG